ncbi:MAG: hypothetical protein EA382_00785 [Spirochaetaceae bacterium]|nr:MAG: hypothetical protein EA382_00785 [Spirochaetaceae bacterium]
MTATELRQKLYVVLAELAEQGGSVRVTHKNRAFTLTPEEGTSFTSRLIRHDTLSVPADDLVAAESAGWLVTERTLDGLP